MSQITPERIAVTEALIRPYIRRTPVLQVDLGDFGLKPHPVVLKLEAFQHAGSFKVRGAFANLLTPPLPSMGVAAASGGNHGAAVAYAAMRLGVKATIFVPSVVSPAKAERIRRYGAELVIAGKRYADALAASEQFVEASGARAIHAFDQPETLLGQGTLGKEIEEDCPDVDTLFVAVGGGGLIAGIAAWLRGRVKLVAVEPESAPTLSMALRAGRPVEAPAGGIAADSLAPKQVGTLMFPIAQDYVAASILVTDDAIRRAQAALWDVARIVTEPGGAAALAALLSGGYTPAAGERICILVCGANTDGVRFPATAEVPSAGQ
jgi:threonine dehydratase